MRKQFDEGKFSSMAQAKYKTLKHSSRTKIMI